MATLGAVLMLSGAVWPTTHAATQGSPAAPAPAAGSLRADFNQDGFADLAVGVREDVGAIGGAGAVNVLYGTADGLTGAGSQFWTQDSPGVGGSTEASDEFGRSLATGDYDHDGYADLAVAAPAEDVGGVFDAGAVNVLYGSAGGLTGAGSQYFTQNTPGVGSSAEQSDLFGAELTAGDFDHDGYADLAIGVHFEDVGSVFNAGGVNVLYGGASGLSGTGSQFFTQDIPGVPSSAEALDNFGWALAAGDFNHDGLADLAIGAPFEAVGAIDTAGAVTVLYGSTAGLTSAGSQRFTQDTPGVGSTAEGGDDFGAALTAGDFNGDGFADLAVGASFEEVGGVPAAGAVNVLYGSAGGLTGAGSQYFTQNTPGVGSSAERDVFGAALAAGDFDRDGFADLAVGAPAEAVGGGFEVGAVNVLYGSGGGLTGAGSQYFTQDSPGVGSSAEGSDRFGSALATGDFNLDGFADLAVGAPGEEIGVAFDAGAVNVLYGSAGGLTGAGSQYFTQNTPGVGSSAEEEDFFGAALAASGSHSPIAR